MGKIKDKFARILYPPGTTRLEPKVSCALVLILFSTQLTLTTPFSYLPSMVKSFGYHDKDAGYYAGIIASSLFVGRFFGGYFWGYLTDKLGRRPVLLLSAILTYCATLFFGFSTNLYFAMFARFLQGLCNGVIVCGRAAFAEICDDTNQAIGVSLVFAAWNSAIVLGPAMGGFLANPTRKYPKLFGSGSVRAFFRKFRYLLPSIVISSLLMISIVAVYLFFEETMVSKKDIPEGEEEEEDEVNLEKIPDTARLLGKDEDEFIVYDQNDQMTKITKEEKTGEDQDDDLSFQKEPNVKVHCCRRFVNGVKETHLFSLISDKIVSLTVGLFGLSGFIIIGFQELTSLWMASGVKLGGLGFTTDKIGLALLFPALASVVLQPIMFGRLERRVGGIRTLQICLVILCIMTVCLPFISAAHNRHKLLWFLLIASRFIRMISDISVRSALSMFVNNSVYSEQAGVVNGYAFSVQEVMRSFSPSLLGSLFAWSVRYGRKIGFPLGHHIAFFVLGFLIVVEFIISFCLPESINVPKKKPSRASSKCSSMSSRRSTPKSSKCQT